VAEDHVANNVHEAPHPTAWNAFDELVVRQKTDLVDNHVISSSDSDCYVQTTTTRL